MLIHYDSHANPDEISFDDNNDGIIDRIEIQLHTYDENDNLKKAKFDLNNDGVFENVFYYTWENV